MFHLIRKCFKFLVTESLFSTPEAKMLELETLNYLEVTLQRRVSSTTELFLPDSNSGSHPCDPLLSSAGILSVHQISGCQDLRAQEETW